MPLAVARARAGNPLAGASAEPVQDTGADESNGSNGTNGHGGALEQASPPQLQGPQLEGPQLEGPQLEGPQLEGSAARGTATRGPAARGRPQLEGPQLEGLQPKGPRLTWPRFTWPRLSGPWRRRAILVAWPVGLAAAGVVLYLCYLAISRTEEVTSDGASIALQAWDMLHGNPLLRGWTLTDVSFYTTELPEYMIVEAVRGLNADVVHASAAITYTLVVLTGRPAGPGPGQGPRGHGPPLHRRRDHGRAAVRPGRIHPGLPARPLRHLGAAAADLAGPGPRSQEVVCPARHRADAGLGRDRRPADPAHRRGPAGRGLRRARLPDPGPAPRGVAQRVVRRVPAGGRGRGG